MRKSLGGGTRVLSIELLWQLALKATCILDQLF